MTTLLLLPLLTPTVPAHEPALPVTPSSHREAPAITETPKVDGTDFYMFRSYEPGREDHVVFVANYLPLQDPYGGPNYFTLDPNARYEIRIDNDGDALEDLTFQFRFQTTNRGISLPVGNPGAELDVPIPLVLAGPVSAADDTLQNVVEEYGLRVVYGAPGPNARSFAVTNPADGSTRFRKPLDNIGTKSISDYASYADAFEYDVVLPGGTMARMFVGQRKDPFVVNLGETFDLVNLNPLGGVADEEDDLADKNVTSLILEVPISFLTDGDDVIGAWTTAQLLDPTTGLKQVSRLGMPLVNEVVVGLADKDTFNGSSPAGDAQFLDYVTNPTFPELLEVLFGVRAPDLFPRQDLIDVFLTGVPGLNQPASVTPAEMLRLNTAIPPTPLGLQNNLGVIGGDLAGYPNGRRPGDDVVDITLRAAMGVLLDDDVAPDGDLPYTDGAFVDDGFFDAGFPFLRDPLPGAPSSTAVPR